MFDWNSQRIEECFNTRGVFTSSGVSELLGIEVVDDIGHVNVSSRCQVFHAYLTWLKTCTSVASICTLPSSSMPRTSSVLTNSVSSSESFDFTSIVQSLYAHVNDTDDDLKRAYKKSTKGANKKLITGAYNKVINRAYKSLYKRHVKGYKREV